MEHQEELDAIRVGIKDAVERLPSIEARPTVTSALLFLCALGRAYDAAEKLYSDIKNPPPPKPVIQRRVLTSPTTEKKSKGFF